MLLQLFCLHGKTFSLHFQCSLILDILHVPVFHTAGQHVLSGHENMHQTASKVFGVGEQSNASCSMQPGQVV